MISHFQILLLVGLSLPGQSNATPTQILGTDLPNAQDWASEAKFPNPCCNDQASCPCSCYPCWAGAELLLWQVRGMHLPPLITSSPPGTPFANAGVLGEDGTEVLYGGSHVNNGLRVGPLIYAGAWLDDDCCWGIDADFFFLQTLGSGINASSDGSQILGRPFLDASVAPPLSNAELVAFPGILAGNVQVSASSTGLLGAGLLLRHKLCCWDGFRLDGLMGYRYLRIHDSISIAENLTANDPTQANLVPYGTNIQLNDSFSTSNQFHGVDLGLVAEKQWENWTLNLRGKVALGTNQQTAAIDGLTTVSVPGLAPVSSPGGLLALSSNSGNHGQGHFSVVPQVDLRLGYRVTSRLTATVSYTFLDWIGVARAGDQIDPTVNSNLLPPVTPPVAGPARPAFHFQQTDLLINGVSFGLEYCF